MIGFHEFPIFNKFPAYQVSGANVYFLFAGSITRPKIVVPGLVPNFNWRRQKRSLLSDDDHVINKRSAVKREFTWPTPSGITEEEARQNCTNAIRTSPAFHKCFELFGNSLFEGVGSCVVDIQVSSCFLLSQIPTSFSF